MDVTAQQEINTNYTTQINALFSDLDKTRVPHGILLDFGMEYTNVSAYNGTLTDSTYVNKETLKQVYNTLFMSRIQNITNGFVNPNEREQLWKNERSSSFIALSGLYFKYSKFIEDANTTNKLIYTNNKFYDKFINGVWQGKRTSFFLKNHIII
jgi:hypothetical protein